MAGTRFESNTATVNNGGALCVYGMATLDSANRADRVVFGSETEADKNSTAGKGGAIFGYGTITATNVDFLNNSAGETGGAVYNTTRPFKDGQGTVTSAIRGDVTLTNALFRGNTADFAEDSSSDFGHGGALANWGEMLITDCTFDKNSAYRGGGAIVNGDSDLTDYPTTMTITGSTFTRNSARIGGAVNNIGQLTLDQCVFGGIDPNDSSSLGNNATKNGGALCNGVGGTLTFADTANATTFLNNTAGN